MTVKLFVDKSNKLTPWIIESEGGQMEHFAFVVINTISQTKIDPDGKCYLQISSCYVEKNPNNKSAIIKHYLDK